MWLAPRIKPDLDRLHKATEVILSQSYRYRGEGITFAFLYLMVGEIQLANESNNYLYVTDSDEAARKARVDLSNLASWEAPFGGLFYSDHNLFRLNKGPIFHFTSVDDIAVRAKSKSFSRIFWDVSEERCLQLVKTETIHDIHAILNAHLLPDGDIV